MTIAWWVALGALAVLALGAAIAHYHYWVARLTVPLEYVDEERIATPDGSAIELRRIPPLRETREGEVEVAPEKIPVALAQAPILLVHGVGINHQNTDVLPDLSLARHLAAQGRDVWLLTLRTGRSDIKRRERGLLTFDRMMRFDLPIGISRILERTGAPSLDYVGFSMGGILLYAAIGRTIAADQIRRVAIIGSPAIVRVPWPLAYFAMLRFLPWWLVPTVPLRILSRMIAFAADWIRTPIHHLVFNPENVERGIAGASLMTVQDFPAALSLEFLRWSVRGAIEVEGRPLTDRLEGLRVPALFFAGSRDRLAPPESVRAAYEAWGRSHQPEVQKRFVLLSREAGASADYGHGDLAIGRHLRRDVFDPITAFLAE